MTKILEGVRILEVAEHTFVPAASAALADLGAEVIKIEHVSRGRRDARARLHGRGDHGGRRARAPRALQSGQAEPRSRPCPAGRPRGALQAGRHLRRVPDEQAAPGRARSSRSTSTTSGPTTRTSSTSAVRGRATVGPTPTRVRTTPSPTGRAPASPTARSGRRTTTSRCRPRRRSVTRSGRSRSPVRSWEHCSTASARGMRPSSTCRCWPPACGRWVERWPCRCR